MFQAGEYNEHIAPADTIPSRSLVAAGLTGHARVHPYATMAQPRPGLNAQIQPATARHRHLYHGTPVKYVIAPAACSTLQALDVVKLRRNSEAVLF
jgi:hypothetical protein